MATYPFASTPNPAESDILRVCDAERERQWRTLIMIPSESICHPAAAEVMASDLGNIYAEGLPEPLLCHDPRESAGDEAHFQSWQTRMADRRFYKGTVNANRVELLAQRNIAEVFARLPGSPRAEKIHVNVQPLSGAAANLAVYTALLKPGDRIMGLDLGHGGHLTHGSPFNFSGKTYEAHAYGIDPKTRRLDYGRIRAQAREARPRIIIGGASSYPWDFDWKELRSIADEAGAYLLADIAHLAGMIAAGALMNPFPHAHVAMFTTHKTLCGPRGAALLSLDPEIARKIDLAVFPGMQGGPHMNSIAAIGRLFELIQTDYEGFRQFERRVIENARRFAQYLAEEGFTIEYGGTNTHMLLVDLKPWRVPGDVPLDGEIASRLLEIAGIVCNKNVLPGDPDAAHASGLRFGLPWLTQRGVTDAHLREIARVAKAVLQDVRTFAIWSPTGDRKCRGRVKPGVLREAARRTSAIAEALPYPPRPRAQRPVDGSAGPSQGAVVGDRVALLVRGEKVALALDELLSARLPEDAFPVRAEMRGSGGRALDDVVALRLPPAGREERWLLLPHADRAAELLQWLRDLSDGYLLFDPADPWKKIDGPWVAEPAGAELLPKDLAEQAARLPARCDASKPYFVGEQGASAPAPEKAPYAYAPREAPLRRTALNGIHRALGAKMVPFAGWEMPVQYPTGILPEHRAVRTAAGLFDVSHMSRLEVSGPHALAFLELLLTNAVSRLAPGEAQYTTALYPDGTHVDDLYVYRLERDRFIIVSNAANSARVRDWILAVNSHQYVIDPARPGVEAPGPVAFRGLRDAGEDSLLQLALQGPLSLGLLQAMSANAEEHGALHRLTPNTFTSATLAGARSVVARTGYTGEKMGFEVMCHPRDFERLWNAIQEEGKPLGVLPAGLGARDSTRVEAGLPLFGHELEGDLGISIIEAGYGFVMRFHKPFFIGRQAFRERIQRSRRRLLRLRGQGRKTLRAGHVILDAEGRVAGQVTSFAYAHADMTFFLLACVREDFQPEPCSTIRGARFTADKWSGASDEQSLVDLTVMCRFPDEEERAAWVRRYA